MQLYLVMGCGGDHQDGDYLDWPVMVLRDKKRAEEWVNILTKEASHWRKDKDKTLYPPNDPLFDLLWGEAKYFIVTIPLKE